MTTTRANQRVLPALVIALSVALAGCVGGDGEEAGGGNGDAGDEPVAVLSSFDVFAVSDLAVTARGLPGEAGAWFEDAALTVRFTVTNTGTHTSREFVTLVIAGDVVGTDRVRLAPNESISMDHEFTRDESGTFSVRVRTAGDEVARDVTLEPRARVGDEQVLPGLTASVTGTGEGGPGYATLNVTLADHDRAGADGDDAHVTKVGARLVCAPDGDDAPFEYGWADLPVPAPGESRDGTVQILACPDGSALHAAQMVAWVEGEVDPRVVSWLTG